MPLRSLKSQPDKHVIVFGEQFVLRLFHKLDEGPNPGLELSRFLTANGFEHSPTYYGTWTLHRTNGDPITLGLLTDYVHSEGTAWEFAQSHLGRFYEQVLTMSQDQESSPPELPAHRLMRLSNIVLDETVQSMLGGYLEIMSLFGKRTGQLHAILASDRDDPVFAPEPYTRLKLRSIYQQMRSQALRTLNHLKESLPDLPEDIQPLAYEVLGREREFLELYELFRRRKVYAERIRCHGYYNLGQVLFTGKDFVLIDFEGDPDRPFSERRIKRSPLRDVASMIRSIHYAAFTALRSETASDPIRRQDFQSLMPWATFWSQAVSASFLESYLIEVAALSFLPRQEENVKHLLDAFLLEKMLQEVEGELAFRPSWVDIPLESILRLLDERKISMTAA
jgi:maltose alpha-D-glucosyltransferase/alpha-amylase